MKPIVAFTILLLTTSFVSPHASHGQGMNIYSDTSASLLKRLAAARAEAKKENSSQSFWIGWSIERTMGRHSFIGSYYSDESRNRPSLRELVTGMKPDPMLRQKEDGEFTTADVDADREEKMVPKEVAILLHYSNADAETIDDVAVSNISLHVDLHGDHLYWLGMVPHPESRQILVTAYAKAGSVEVKKHLLMAIALHQDVPSTMKFLKEILSGSGESELREDAAFWIGQTGGSEAVDILKQTAESDRSEDVMEKAIFGLSQIKGDASTDALISVARTHKNDEMRKKAIFWLSQKASAKAVAALKDFVYNEKETELQKQALFALTQTDGKDGIDELITIARTHPNPSLRKDAIFWLGQSDDPKALEAIVKIIQE